MNIIILTDSYFPKVNSGAIIVGDLVSELKEQGHEITVATFIDDINHGYSDDFENGVRVIRISVRDRTKSKFIRGYVESTFSRKIITTIKSIDDIKVDSIICYSPSIFFGAAVNWLKRRFNANSYLIMRDIFPKWAVDAGLLKKNLVYYYFKYIEKKLYDSVDVIGIESKSDLDYFKKITGKKKIKIEVLSNWSSPINDIYDKAECSVLERDKVNIVYGGNVGDAQDLLSLVRLIDDSVLDGRAVITIIGDGSQVVDLQKEILIRNIKNIVLLPTVDRQKYLSILSSADIGLISLNHKLTGHNYPLKLLSYMQLSKPTLAIVNQGNEIVDMIKQYEVGLVSIATDKKLINENISSLISNEALRKRLGDNSLSLFNDKYTVQAAVRQICSNL
jgi:glycosyltransferase involved in cell wall biosynthesis